jgi:hypothetical protein
MFFKKKSQGALEFLLILLFLFIIISVMIYIVSKYSLDFQKSENDKIRDDFVKNILVESEIASKATPGYSRTYVVPEFINKRYYINVTSGFLLLKDLEYGNNETYLYTFLGDVNITFIPTNSSSNVSYIIFKKPNTISYEGLDLS